MSQDVVPKIENHRSSSLNGHRPWLDFASNKRCDLLFYLDYCLCQQTLRV